MRLNEFISNEVGDGVFYDPVKGKVKFKGSKPKLTLRALKKARLMKSKQEAHDKVKQAQWELMYGNKELGEQETDLDAQKRNDHLDKLAQAHIKRNLGEANE